MTQPAVETPTPADVAKPAPEAAHGSPESSSKPSGADSAAVDKPGETPKPAKAKDHAAVAREHFRLRQERKGLRAETDAKLAEMKSQLDAVLAKNKAAEDKAAQLEKERAEFLADPISFAERHGRKPDDVVTGYVKKGTPEALAEQTRREVAEERAKREALEKQLADEREAQKKQRAEDEAKQQAAAQAAAVTNFLHAVTKEAKKYPYLNFMYEPAEIQAKAAEFQKMAIAEGKAYQFEEVAGAFETFAKKAYEKKEAKRLELLTPSEDEGEPAPAAGIQAKPAPGNGRREGTNGPRERTAPKTEQPKLSRRLTRAEQDAADLAALRAATAKDRAATKSS